MRVFAVVLIGTHRAGGVVRRGDTHREAETPEVPIRIGSRGKFCWLKLNSRDGESQETLLFNLPDAGEDLVNRLDRAIGDRELDTTNAVGAATISPRPAVVFSVIEPRSSTWQPSSFECRAVRAGLQSGAAGDKASEHLPHEELGLMRRKRLSERRIDTISPIMQHGFEEAPVLLIGYPALSDEPFLGADSRCEIQKVGVQDLVCDGLISLEQSARAPRRSCEERATDEPALAGDSKDLEEG